MTVPFSIDQFLEVFAIYNAAIWPAQIIAYALGIAALLALWSGSALSSRVILSILALMWMLNGIGYHFLYFSAINPAARLFAGLFVLEALLLAGAAMAGKSATFKIERTATSVAGIAFIVYAMLLYPVLGVWAGHGVMAGPMFGVAPCPTTIFTIGLLLLSRGPWAAWLSIIPLLWSVVGLAATVQLGILEDFGLTAAGLVFAIVLADKALRLVHRGRATEASARAAKA